MDFFCKTCKKRRINKYIGEECARCQELLCRKCRRICCKCGKVICDECCRIYYMNTKVTIHSCIVH